MKPHPKLRKAVKWGGLSACIVLVAVWAVSGRVVVHYCGRDGSTAGLAHGCLFAGFTQPHPKLPLIWISGDHEAKYFHVWWFRVDRSGGRVVYCTPLWVLALPTFLATAAAWRLDTRAKRRTRAGKCITCGYDLRGLVPGALCPECGAASSVIAKAWGACAVWCNVSIILFEVGSGLGGRSTRCAQWAGPNGAERLVRGCVCVLAVNLNRHWSGPRGAHKSAPSPSPDQPKEERTRSPTRARLAMHEPPPRLTGRSAKLAEGAKDKDAVVYPHFVAQAPTISATPRKPRWRRLRWLVKWGGLAASVVIVLAFIVSIWWDSGVWYAAQRGNGQVMYGVGIRWGCSWVCRWSIPARMYKPGIDWDSEPTYGDAIEWMPVIDKGPVINAVFIPLWMFLPFTAIPAAVGFYRDRASVRRAREGQCIKCGYNLHGLTPGSPCPECGASAATMPGRAR